MKKLYTSKYYNFPIEVIINNEEVSVIVNDSLDRKSIYSWYNIQEKNSPSPYINQCLLGSFLQDNIENVLVIGAGGGAFIKYLEDHIPDVQITGIDIDETMIDIAKNELGIKTNNLILGDCNKVIDILISQNRKYDIILFDIYGSNGEIPISILKNGFFEKLEKLLKSTGIFSINYSNFYILSKERKNNHRNQTYQLIHNELKKYFGEKFIAFTSGEKNGENVSGIYNLKKKFTRSDIKNIYFNKVKDNKIILDPKIIESIYLDNQGKFLN